MNIKKIKIYISILIIYKMFLNKLFGFFIFTFNLIITIITLIYIFNNINSIFSHVFFIIVFILLLFLIVFSLYFSIAVAIKKQIQKHLNFIQVTGFLTFFYHFVMLLIIYISATVTEKSKIELKIFLISGILSMFSMIVLCLTNYGYKEEFINYNYDVERQRDEVVIQVNNDIEEPIPDPEIEEHIGELSISMNAYDNEYEVYKPTAPEYEGAYDYQ